MTTAAEPVTRAPILRVLGWVLLVAAALLLAAAAYWVPWAHFGTIATGPTDTAALVRSFNLSWGLSVLLLGAVYAAGIALARAPRASAPRESDDARQFGPLRFATISFGAGLLTIAGISLAVCIILFRVVPVGVSVVTGLWCAILILFVATSLWGALVRSLGLTLVSAGLVLVLFVMFLASAVLEPTGLEAVERLIKDVAIDKGGAGLLATVSWALASLPIATAGLLVVGLPLLMALRRRLTGGSMPAIIVGLLLLGSSFALPRTMALVALVSPPALPGVAWSSLVMMSLPPPPPPPPPLPPPDAPPGAVAGSTPSTLANPSMSLPPPPPAAPPSPTVVPVRVGGSVRAPKRVKGCCWRSSIPSGSRARKRHLGSSRTLQCAHPEQHPHDIRAWAVLLLPKAETAAHAEELVKCDPHPHGNNSAEFDSGIPPALQVTENA